MVQSIIAQFHTKMNLTMNLLIKQLFTPNDQQLSEHSVGLKTREGSAGVDFNQGSFAKNLSEL